MMDVSVREKTLGELRAEAAKNSMKMTMISPRIENNMPATDTSSAQIRHGINMMQAGLPKRIADIVEKWPFPVSVVNLMIMDALILDAPELLLANIVSEEEAKRTGGLTLRMQIAHFEKGLLDTDIFVPYIYRQRPEYIKLKTILRSEIRILLTRTTGEERERLLQWVTRTIQDVRQSFREEKKQEPQKGGLFGLTRR